MSQLHLNHTNTSMLNTQLSFPRKYHWLALLPHLYPHCLEPPVNICSQDALYVLEGSIPSLLTFFLMASSCMMLVVSPSLLLMVIMPRLPLVCLRTLVLWPCSAVMIFRSNSMHFPS